MNQHIVEQFMFHIQASGSGAFSSFDLAKEIELINQKRSKLSATQRRMTVELWDKVKETKI